MKYCPLACLCLCVLLLVDQLQAESPSTLDPSGKLQLVSDDFQLADGAAWDGRSRLFVPDVKGKKLLTYQLSKPDSPPKARLDGLAISGCCFQLGQLYFSDNGNSRIAVLNNNGPPRTIAQFDTKLRPNDLVVDAHGNVYVTITREGVIRRIDHQNTKTELDAEADQAQAAGQIAGTASNAIGAGKGRAVVKDLVTPNGIALSPDGLTLYVSSAKEGTISKIAIDSTSDVWTAEPFAQLENTDDGFRGDGMCVDRAGNVYVTGAKSVSVFSPSGKQIDQITTPHRPINVIIGGTDSRSLYISTFGGLYRQRVNAYGVSPNPPLVSSTAIPTSPSTAIPANLQADLNVVYAEIDDRKLLMDIFRPTKSSSNASAAIVVVHGGGWLKGDKTKFRSLAIQLASMGYVTAAIEYRLGFEAKFPAAILDCNAATHFLRSHATQYGIDPNRIAAVGGSAGGHLVGLMAAGSQNALLKHGSAEDCSLQAAVVMAGPLQTSTGSVADRSHDLQTNSNAVNWIGNTIDELPDLYALADAHQKIDQHTTPMLFISGSLDNPDRNAASRDKLNALGIATGIVIHEGAKHGHWNRPEWIEQVVQDIDVFLKKHL